MSEREQSSLQPNELPPELADFLRDKEYACLLWGTDQGSVFVAKAPAREIQSLRGNIPVRILHQLYEHPQAPVIRTVITWYDQPTQPLALETFINVADPQQRTDFTDLANQQELRFLFYDRALRHRLSKLVRNPDPETITQIAQTAERLQATIPEESFDFDAAKADIIKRTFL
jgi:hypothetical protein